MSMEPFLKCKCLVLSQDCPTLGTCDFPGHTGTQPAFNAHPNGAHPMRYTKCTCMGCSLECRMCTSREGLPYVPRNCTLDLQPGYRLFVLQECNICPIFTVPRTHTTRDCFFISELLRRIGPAPQKILPCL